MEPLIFKHLREEVPNPKQQEFFKDSKVRDENGNLLSYSNEAIKVTAEGPIEIIGPDMFSLRGGMAGFYVKTTGEKGEANVKISCPRFEDKIIEFKIN